jgi:hypothetical protein
MKRRHQEVGAAGWSAVHRSCAPLEDALKFSDECWAEGLRLAASQANYYQLIMDVVRWSLTS